MEGFPGHPSPGVVTGKSVDLSLVECGQSLEAGHLEYLETVLSKEIHDFFGCEVVRRSEAPVTVIFSGSEDSAVVLWVDSQPFWMQMEAIDQTHESADHRDDDWRALPGDSSEFSDGGRAFSIGEYVIQRPAETNHPVKRVGLEPREVDNGTRDNLLDSTRDACASNVPPSLGQQFWSEIEEDHAIASPCQLDGVSSRTAPGVEDDTTPWEVSP